MTAHATVADASAVDITPQAQTPAVVETVGLVARDRWLAHADFCRKQSALWTAYAANEANPIRRKRYERDAAMNFSTAQFAMRQGLFAQADEVRNVAA